MIEWSASQAWFFADKRTRRKWLHDSGVVRLPEPGFAGQNKVRRAACCTEHDHVYKYGLGWGDFDAVDQARLSLEMERRKVIKLTKSEKEDIEWRLRAKEPAAFVELDPKGKRSRWVILGETGG